jgi:MFS family permease
MLFLSYFHYDIAFTPLLYAYPTEIFPYALGGAGVSLTCFSSHVGLIISQFATPIAMGNISWRYYTVFAVLNAVLFIIVWFCFPEVKGIIWKKLHLFLKVAKRQLSMPNLDVRKREIQMPERYILRMPKRSEGGLKA